MINSPKKTESLELFLIKNARQLSLGIFFTFLMVVPSIFMSFSLHSNQLACQLFESNYSALSGPLSRELMLDDHKIAASILSDFKAGFNGQFERLKLVDAPSIPADTKAKKQCKPGLLSASVQQPVAFDNMTLAYIVGDINKFSSHHLVLVILVPLAFLLIGLNIWNKKLNSFLTRSVLNPIQELTSGKQINDTDKATIEVYSVAKSIDQLKTSLIKQQQALAETEKNKKLGELAVKVAHDIRSPLGALNIAKTKLQPDPEDPVSSLISASIDKIQCISDQLLETYRSTENKTKKIDISSVINEALPSLIENAHSKEIHLAYNSLQTNTPPALVDLPRASLLGIINNIVENSIDAFNGYDSDHKTIDVQLNINDLNHSVDLTITDNGKGMPPEIKQRVTENGFTSGKRNGNGFGMYSVFNDIKSASGTLSINSEEHLGTTITISLPYYLEPLANPKSG